jgi:hypothetical protein
LNWINTWLRRIISLSSEWGYERGIHVRGRYDDGGLVQTGRRRCCIFAVHAAWIDKDIRAVVSIAVAVEAISVFHREWILGKESAGEWVIVSSLKVVKPALDVLNLPDVTNLVSYGGRYTNSKRREVTCRRYLTDRIRGSQYGPLRIHVVIRNITCLYCGAGHHHPSQNDQRTENLGPP